MDEGKSWTTFLMRWSLAVGASVGTGAVSAWEARGESWTYTVAITALTMVFAGLVCVLTVEALRALSVR